MEFLAVDVLSQIPASFYTQIESKKWSDRKEALEVIEKITAVPQIENADLNELVRVLKKIVAKDSNVVVSTLAAKCICQIAQGLRFNFGPYANQCLTVFFEKFKEKKPNVNSVIRDAADAAFIGTNLENTYEDVIEFLNNKNPQIKSETALFLARVFSRHSEQVMNKKTLRPLITALIKTLSDMDATVRDSSATAIGTAMKVAGEKLMTTLLTDVEPIKISKIKEFCEKAEIYTPPVNGHTFAPESQEAPVAQVNGVVEDNQPNEVDEYDMLEAVDISNQIPASFYTQIESKKWSDRKEALEVIEKITAVPKIENADLNEPIRVLRKIVAKDSNIVVATLAAKCICQIAQGLRFNFGPYANQCLTVFFEKFKEKKPNVNSVIRDAADAAFIGTNLENTYEDVIEFLNNKNPQIKSETALFLARVFSRHSEQVMNKKTLRPLITALIKTLSDMDATVRDSSATAIGTAMKVVGEKLMTTLLADVEAIKISKIKEFCEKAQVKKVIQPQQLNMPAAPVVMPPPKSSATMVRSSSSKKLPTSKANINVPKSNATVKRTATIIKRSTVSARRVSHQPQPAQQLPQQQPQQQQSIPQPRQINHNQIQQPAPPTHVIANNVPIIQQQPQQQQQQPNKLNDFDLSLFKLISDDPTEVTISIKELECSLSESETHAKIKTRINQLIDLTCLQMIKDPSDEQKVRRICDCLRKLFSQTQLVSSASKQTIRFLLIQVLTLTQLYKEKDTVVALNNLASAVIDSFEPTNIMCILTGLLNEPSATSIIEPIKLAIIRTMRSFK